jgi:hypothetical protein
LDLITKPQQLDQQQQQVQHVHPQQQQQQQQRPQQEENEEDENNRKDQRNHDQDQALIQPHQQQQQQQQAKYPDKHQQQLPSAAAAAAAVDTASSSDLKSAAVAVAAVATSPPLVDVYQELVMPSHSDPIQDLLEGKVRSVEFCGGQVVVDAPRRGRVYLPGSFNPLHEGHKQLLETAVKAAAAGGEEVEGCFELSVGNADKV